MARQLTHHEGTACSVSILGVWCGDPFFTYTSLGSPWMLPTGSTLSAKAGMTVQLLPVYQLHPQADCSGKLSCVPSKGHEACPALLQSLFHIPVFLCLALGRHLQPCLLTLVDMLFPFLKKAKLLERYVSSSSQGSSPLVLKENVHHHQEVPDTVFLLLSYSHSFLRVQVLLFFQIIPCSTD